MSEKCKYSGHEFVPRPGGEPGEQICQRCDYYPTPAAAWSPEAPPDGWLRLSDQRVINTLLAKDVQLITMLNRWPMEYRCHFLIKFHGELHEGCLHISDPAEVAKVAEFFRIQVPADRQFTEADLDDGDEDFYENRERLIELGRMVDPDKDRPCVCIHPKWQHKDGKCLGLHAREADSPDECGCERWIPAPEIQQATSEVVF